jgi:hypothetical protein
MPPSMATVRGSAAWRQGPLSSCKPKDTTHLGVLLCNALPQLHARPRLRQSDKALQLPVRDWQALRVGRRLLAHVQVVLLDHCLGLLCAQGRWGDS